MKKKDGSQEKLGKVDDITPFGRNFLKADNINDLPLNTAAEINIARRRLENILSQTDEIQYAKEQCNQWQEIADYMELLIKGGRKAYIR